MGRLCLGVGSRILCGAEAWRARARLPLRRESSGAPEPMEHLEKNPFYEKYAARIAARQAATGAAPAPPRAPAPTPRAPDTARYASVLNPKKPLERDAAAETKRLDAIFKIDLVENKDALDIQTIWEEYHKNKDVISATIPLELYGALRDSMRAHPTFLFPLPRAHGYEFMLCQSAGHAVHCTPLLAYQVHRENAPECLTMVHYTELQGKGIVLMRGEYDKNVLNGQEAQCLANQFQMYYSGKDPAKLQLLQTFTRAPDSFKHIDLIAQMENIVLT